MDRIAGEIERVLEFVVEIEKLKDVHRKTRPVGLSRHENSAEHSWQVCLAAWMLEDYADEAIRIDRVIRMLLLHDLGEIDAGDTIIYESESRERKEEEADGVRRVLSLLPGERTDEYMELWYEFEAGETKDAKFAKAIDRVPPLLQNLHGDGHAWREHGISAGRVLALNSRIREGSRTLWQVLERRLKEAFTGELRG